MEIKPLSKFISLDLEMNKPSDSIIEVGFCVGDLNTKSILEKRSYIINCKEDINPYITELTGITQDQVNNGTTLQEAYEEIKKLHNQYDCFKNYVQWGHGDSEKLKQDLGLNGEVFSGGRRTIDVKTLFQSYRLANQLPIQGGLARSMTKMGLKFQGRKHSGVDDSINTFYMFCSILEKMKDENK
jgi:inhibitor of KinA sporulation pathway (predicted exonuclease)